MQHHDQETAGYHEGSARDARGGQVMEAHESDAELLRELLFLLSNLAQSPSLQVPTLWNPAAWHAARLARRQPRKQSPIPRHSRRQDMG